jgi:hypothetical protein
VRPHRVPPCELDCLDIIDRQYVIVNDRILTGIVWYGVTLKLLPISAGGRGEGGGLPRPRGPSDSVRPHRVPPWHPRFTEFQSRAQPSLGGAVVWCPSYLLGRNRCNQVVAAGPGAG